MDIKWYDYRCYALSWHNEFDYDIDYWSHINDCDDVYVLQELAFYVWDGDVYGDMDLQCRVQWDGLQFGDYI